jgi:hypothetical protein
MTDATPSPTDHLRNTLEEMRVSVTAEGTRKGLAGALQSAILRLLNALVALLAEFKAGTLGALEDGQSTGEAATAREPDATALSAADAGGAGAHGSGRPMAVLSADGSGDAGVDRGGSAGDADVKPNGARGCPGLLRGPRSRPAAPSRLQNCSPPTLAVAFAGERFATCHRGWCTRGVRFKKRVEGAMSLCSYFVAI